MQLETKLSVGLLLLLLSKSLLPDSLNNHGQAGYINTPSAFNQEESALTFSFNRGSPERRWMLSASPFNWLDANIFYVDITNKDYPGDFAQTYKDKGFSFKITPGKIFGHNFAIGAIDIGGTGIFSSEYAVLSKSYGNFQYSVGLGWGNYSGGINFSNPLINLSKKFKSRSDKFADLGGNFDLNNYFSGSDTSIFFGGSYMLNSNSTFSFELDPTTENFKVDYPEIRSPFSFGYEYKHKKFSINLSLVRGSSLNVGFKIGSLLDQFNSNMKDPIIRRISTPSELQKVLQENNIGLISVEKNNSKLIINAKQNSFFNQYEPNNIIYKNGRSIDGDFKEIVISQYYLGMKATEMIYDKRYPSISMKEEYVSVDEAESIYSVIEKYPFIVNRLAPKIKNFIASREGFYYAGLLLEDDLEIFFNENIFFIANFKYSIIDNFDELYIPPRDTYPNQVRSDIKDYLNGISNGPVIGRMELNYLNGIGKKHFFRVSAGLFEDSFGGLGGEYLYYPEGSLFAFGLESFFVKKRDYDMRFSFQSYTNTLSRAKLKFFEPVFNVDVDLSYGEYLAGDKGYTLALTRKFKNGVEFGTFFTRTNVSKQLFGEGSFDKGIYLRIPITNIFGNTSLQSITWRPLTKDPGALLTKSIDLSQAIDRFRFY